MPQLAPGMGFAPTGYGAMNLLMIAPSLIMGRIIKVTGGLTCAALGGMILIASFAVSMLYPLASW